jgi:predicted small lipoprotein YifL
MEGKLMMNISKMIVLAFILPLALAACGGGGGGTTPPPQQKSATIIFSTVSSAHTAPLQGISFTAKLPAGVTNCSLLPDQTGRNTGVLNYLDSQTATIGVISLNIPFGPFAGLNCDVTPVVTLTEIVNTPLQDLLVTGKTNAGSTVDLVSQMKVPPVTLSVTFGF